MPLLFTSLAPVTPKVLLNTDIGDSGVIEHRRCNCLYDRIGCHQTLHTVRSSDKITGFGVTFWVADVCDVLETALPRRVGGRTGDYQLLEREAQASLPQYLLLANPDLPELDSERLVETFLTELSARKSYYGFMTAIWRRERAVQVRRRRPVPTATGKVLLFRRASRPEPSVS
jgi:hypothetical protein